jgi:hypothetical protein
VVGLLVGNEGFVGDFDFTKELFDEFFFDYHPMSNLGLIELNR